MSCSLQSAWSTLALIIVTSRATTEQCILFGALCFKRDSKMWNYKRRRKKEKEKEAEVKEKEKLEEEDDKNDEGLWNDVKWEFCRKQDIAPREHKPQRSWEPKCIVVKEADIVNSIITYFMLTWSQQAAKHCGYRCGPRLHSIYNIAELAAHCKGPCVQCVMGSGQCIQVALGEQSRGR